MAEDPRLQAVLDIARTVGSTLDLDELLASTMRTVTQVVGCDRSTLYLLDPHTGELWSRIAQGTEALEIRLAPGTGVAGWVAEHGESVRLDDAYADDRFSHRWDEETGYRTETLLCVPFRNASGVVVGVMQCLNKAQGTFTADDDELLRTIGGQCAVAIENAFLYRSLQERSVQLRSANEELRILVEVERAIAQAPDEGTVLVGALDQLVRTFDAAAAAALVASPGGGHLVVLRADASHEVLRVDAATTERLLNGIGAPGILGPADSLVPAVPAAGIQAPLATDAGLLGLVQVAAPETSFEQGGLRILGLVASRMAKGVEAVREQAARERSERLGLLGAMLSGVLHDLRTPISAVSGYAELMAEEEELEERAYYATRIATALGHMEGMTAEILQYARGTPDLVVSHTTVGALVADVRDMLMAELETFALDLIVDGPLDAQVRIDAGKIRRVIFNLVRNAGQAGASRFEWTIAVDEATTTFRLRDDGPGLPEELRGRLFQPFATHGKSDGTGLGLAMVKGIVDAHGGTVEVDSEPGGGTTFLIALPASPRTGTPLL